MMMPFLDNTSNLCIGKRNSNSVTFSSERGVDLGALN